MINSTKFDAGMSVNTTIRRFPESVAVFNQLGVDACCGGANSLAEAALEAGITLETLVAALEAAVPEGAATS
jgi:iron-sulfur cluster repair protein YtfE (RIC family)